MTITIKGSPLETWEKWATEELAKANFSDMKLKYCLEGFIELAKVKGGNGSVPHTPQGQGGGFNGDKIMPSKYAGRCKDCGQNYAQGDTIRWSRDKGARCETC